LSLLKFVQNNDFNNNAVINSNNVLNERRQISLRNVEQDTNQNAIHNNSITIPDEIRVKIDNIAENLSSVVNNRICNDLSSVSLQNSQLPASFMHGYMPTAHINPSYMYNIPGNANGYILSQQAPNVNNIPFMNGMFRAPYTSFPNFF
jgi:hypothetical protein